MEVDELAAEVEDAADCFSWSPRILRRWLATSKLPTATNEALMALADGVSPDELSSSSGKHVDSLTQEIVQIVNDGPTPNQIRARLKVASERQLAARRAA